MNFTTSISRTPNNVCISIQFMDSEQRSFLLTTEEAAEIEAHGHDALRRWAEREYRENMLTRASVMGADIADATKFALSAQKRRNRVLPRLLIAASIIVAACSICQTTHSESTPAIVRKIEEPTYLGFTAREIVEKKISLSDELMAKLFEDCLVRREPVVVVKAIARVHRTVNDPDIGTLASVVAARHYLAGMTHDEIESAVRQYAPLSGRTADDVLNELRDINP